MSTYDLGNTNFIKWTDAPTHTNAEVCTLILDGTTIWTCPVIGTKFTTIFTSAQTTVGPTTTDWFAGEAVTYATTRFEQILAGVVFAAGSSFSCGGNCTSYTQMTPSPGTLTDAVKCSAYNDGVAAGWTWAGLHDTYSSGATCSDMTPGTGLGTGLSGAQWVTINSTTKLWRNASDLQHCEEVRMLSTVPDVDKSENPVVVRTQVNNEAAAYFRASTATTWNVTLDNNFTDTYWPSFGTTYTGNVTCGVNCSTPYPIWNASGGNTDFTSSCTKVAGSAVAGFPVTDSTVEQCVDWCKSNGYTVIAIEPSQFQTSNPGFDSNSQATLIWRQPNGWTDSFTLLDGMLELTRVGAT